MREAQYAWSSQLSGLTLDGDCDSIYRANFGPLPPFHTGTGGERLGILALFSRCHFIPHSRELRISLICWQYIKAKLLMVYD